MCPLCEKHMTGPKHTPMAAIPCGHTYCKTCIGDFGKCPTCHTVVRSTAVNTIMQGIIKDFKDQKERERLQKMEEQTRQYVDEYQSIENLESSIGCILNWLFFFGLEIKACSGVLHPQVLSSLWEICLLVAAAEI